MPDDDFDARMAAARERVARSRRAQGLPPTIRDKGALAFFAAMFDGTDTPEPEPKRNTGRRSGARKRSR